MNDLLDQKPYTLRRVGRGTRDDRGYYVEGPRIERTIMATVQPVSAPTAQRLGYGGRAKDMRKVYTSIVLQPVDQHTKKEADHLAICGVDYQVVSSNTWDTEEGCPHTRAFVIRIAEAQASGEGSP